MQLHRGQCPHRRPGGNWDVKQRAFLSSGPQAWDDKSEIERTRWDEKMLEPLVGSFNPIAQYEVRGGMTAETHAKHARLDAIAKAGGADEFAWQNAGKECAHQEANLV